MRHTSTALTALLLSLSILNVPQVMAGPHRGMRKVHRRHHARMTTPLNNELVQARRDAGEYDIQIPAGRRGTTKRSKTCTKKAQSDADAQSNLLLAGSSGGNSGSNASAACENGAWQCIGNDLQRCNHDSWVHIQTCSGDNVVCSADDRATGCIWSWSLNDFESGNQSQGTTPVTATPIPSNATSTSTGTAKGTQAAAIQTSAAVDTSSSTVTSAPTSFASAGAVIGGNLYAGDGGDSDDSSSSSSSSSSKGHKHKSSSTTNDWYATGATTITAATASPTQSDDWSDPSSSSSDAWGASSSDWETTSSSSQDWYGHGHKSASATAGASSTTDDWDSWQSASATATTWSEGKSKGGKGTASYSATVSAYSASPTTGSGKNTTTSTPSGSFSAPHYVIYADEWLTRMPDPSQLTSYNRFILAFWMTDSGAVDNAQAWEQWTDDYRQQVLTAYHQAGIAIMVSAFGSTDSPTSNGADPTEVAQRLGKWVKQYGLDGVDIDYEDMPAMNNDKAEAWLITFQQELRRQLPAPYIISHAPVAPWFTSGKDYPSGAYVKIHSETGSGIDFYNVQFYNQGDNVYDDCDSLLHSNGGSWPSTSVFGINSYAGVPLDKIVIGKPIDANAASNGYMTGTTLAKCVSQAQGQGWNGGVMFWEWSESLAPSLMATVRGGS